LAYKKDVLWVKWVHEYYIKERNVLLIKVPSQVSWVVKNVFDAPIKKMLKVMFFNNQTFLSRKCIMS